MGFKSMRAADPRWRRRRQGPCCDRHFVPFVMETSERRELIELYYQNGCSVTLCLRAFRARHGRHSGPSESTLRALVNKFNLSGTVNKQNCRIWATQNPHAIHEQPLHDQKTTVWCGFSSKGVIGPYFFDGTVNGERYRQMLTDFLWPQLTQLGWDNMWFQQDGATCHTARETINLIKQMFGERVISQKADVPWPPRSCDLTPLDFFLWGFLKSKVYASKPATIGELQQNIGAEISKITVDLCQKVIKNGLLRLDHVENTHGGHIHNVIFHT